MDTHVYVRVHRNVRSMDGNAPVAVASITFPVYHFYPGIKITDVDFTIEFEHNPQRTPF